MCVKLPRELLILFLCVVVSYGILLNPSCGQNISQQSYEKLGPITQIIF